MLMFILVPLLVGAFIGLCFFSLSLHATAGTLKVKPAPYAVAFRISLLVISLNVLILLVVLKGWLGSSVLLFVLGHLRESIWAITLANLAWSIVLIQRLYHIDWGQSLRVWSTWCVACALGGLVFGLVFHGAQSVAGVGRYRGTAAPPQPWPVSDLAHPGDSPFEHERVEGIAALSRHDYAAAGQDFDAELDLVRKMPSGQARDSMTIPALDDRLQLQILQRQSTQATIDELTGLEKTNPMLVDSIWTHAMSACLDIQDSSGAQQFASRALAAAHRVDADEDAGMQHQVGRVWLQHHRPEVALPYLKHAYEYEKRNRTIGGEELPGEHTNEVRIFTRRAADYAKALAECGQQDKADQVTSEVSATK